MEKQGLELSVLTPEGWKQLGAALAAPFPEVEVKWKPQVIAGSRALAVAYIDARCVQERLDAVLGIFGWKDAYEYLQDGTCLCRLSLRVGPASEWVEKCDVGSPSEQDDPGDRRKAAASDSLKRAAVKFGVGRYLYRLPTVWRDYDPKTRRFRTDHEPRTTEAEASARTSSAASVGASRKEAVALAAQVGYTHDWLNTQAARRYQKDSWMHLSPGELAILLDFLRLKARKQAAATSA